MKTDAEPQARRLRRRPSRRTLLRAAVIAAAVLVALIAWLATRGGSEFSSAPEATAPAAAVSRIVTEAGLREAAAELGWPIYWAGPRPGTELELTELGEGRGGRVAYQPAGSEAGQGPSDVLAIGSYPLPNPEAALAGYAKRPGSVVRHASDGREVVTSQTAPTSAYFASPRDEVQVEVYDPSPQRAMSLALSGEVRPVG